MVETRLTSVYNTHASYALFSCSHTARPAEHGVDHSHGISTSQHGLQFIMPRCTQGRSDGGYIGI